MNKLADLEEKISSLPEGYVTRKVINNKPYYYHQWKSNGKNLSHTLTEEEVEPLKAKIEERKKLEKELKLVRKITPDISEIDGAITNISYMPMFKDVDKDVLRDRLLALYNTKVDAFQILEGKERREQDRDQ